MNIALILIGALSLAAGWKFKEEKDVSWIGFGYIALVVYVLSFFAIVLTSVSVSEGLNLLRTFLDGDALPKLTSEIAIMGVGLLIMWLVVTVAFIGIVLYVLGVKMTSFFKLVRNLGTYFFIPFLMISFEALLVFALLKGNDVATGVKMVLLFFILVLGLGIWAYIKMIFFSKAKLKWEQTGAGSWSASWVDEDEEDVVEDVKKEKSSKKKMVPLNEGYLKKTDNYNKK